jgi:hypothetical protein
MSTTEPENIAQEKLLNAVKRGSHEIGQSADCLWHAAEHLLTGAPLSSELLNKASWWLGRIGEDREAVEAGAKGLALQARSAGEGHQQLVDTLRCMCADASAAASALDAFLEAVAQGKDSGRFAAEADKLLRTYCAKLTNLIEFTKTAARKDA